MLLDVGEPTLGLSSHQVFDEALDLFCMLACSFPGQDDPIECPFFGVHRRFLQLGGRHFPQPLEATDPDLRPALESGFQKLVLVGVVPGIHRLAALA